MLPPESVSANISILPKSSLRPAQIQTIVSKRNASNIFAPGDLFPVNMSGTAVTVDTTGTWYACILGIDHNKSYDGLSQVDFALPHKEDGTGLAFIDSQYGTNVTIGGMAMNPGDTDTGVGGWTGSYMYKTVMPAFYNCISSDWRSIIKEALKYRFNANPKEEAGEDPGDGMYYQTLCSSFIWLMVLLEILSYSKYNGGLSGSQKRYDYYKNGNSSIRYKYNSQTESATWWAPARIGSKAMFLCISTTGTESYKYSRQSCGVIPCFRVSE